MKSFLHPIQLACNFGSLSCLRLLANRTNSTIHSLKLDCSHDRGKNCCPFARSLQGHIELCKISLYLMQQGARFMDEESYPYLMSLCARKKEQRQLLNRTMIMLVLTSVLFIKRLGKKSMFSSYMTMDLVRTLDSFLILK